MNKRKFLRLLSVVLCLPLTVSALSGCSGTTTGNTASSEAETAPGSSAQEAVGYDFSASCRSYLEYISSNLADRDLLPDGKTDDANRHAAAVDWITGELKSDGYSDTDIKKLTFSAEDADGSYSGTNIELTVPGQDSDRQIIVGAHYDGDGIGDNGSGLALLLGVIRGLTGQTPACTVKYVFFDGEEQGLYGSDDYAASMSKTEVSSTIFMVNADSIAFGDYCNIYGGVMKSSGTVTDTDAYDLAAGRAKALGMNVLGPDDLDGYYSAHGSGPQITDDTLYTNPWTKANPAPKNSEYFSPSVPDVGDHVGFRDRGIKDVYFEATNWYAAGDGGSDAYTGYFETADTSLGYYGMFMNTQYDTLANLDSYFPGRALKHFSIYSRLLSSLVMQPEQS